MAKCKRKPEGAKRGGREALSVEQLVHLFFVFLLSAPVFEFLLLRDFNSAWTAVHFLIGVMLSERCDLHGRE